MPSTNRHHGSTSAKRVEIGEGSEAPHAFHMFLDAICELPLKQSQQELAKSLSATGPSLG